MDDSLGTTGAALEAHGLGSRLRIVFDELLQRSQLRDDGFVCLLTFSGGCFQGLHTGFESFVFIPQQLHLGILFLLELLYRADASGLNTVLFN